MTKEEIIDIVDNFKYFTQDLTPIRSAVEGINKDLSDDEREEAYVRFSIERDIVNRFITIEECIKWDEGINSEFYRGLQKKQVTNNKNPHHPMTGIIPHWGIKMSPQEFELYEEVYHELYELV